LTNSRLKYVLLYLTSSPNCSGCYMSPIIGLGQTLNRPELLAAACWHHDASTLSNPKQPLVSDAES